MYELIKQVIQTKAYKDSNALIAKIQRMYVEDGLTEEQYTELRAMLAENDPAKAYNAEAEIDALWVEIRNIKAQLAALNAPEPVEGEDEPEETIPDFVQPTGAHDAYQQGDRVTFNGEVYESLINGNVWSPETYPAGWEKV